MAAKTRLYVGNISYDSTEADLRAFFAPRQVTEVKMMTERDTGRPRGFCFVEVATEAEALDAIDKLHETSMRGRRIVVNAANEKPRTSGGGGGRGAGGGGQRERDGYSDRPRRGRRDERDY